MEVVNGKTLLTIDDIDAIRSMWFQGVALEKIKEKFNVQEKESEKLYWMITRLLQKNIRKKYLE